MSLVRSTEIAHLTRLHRNDTPERVGDSIMKIHTCRRCDGCGHIAGGHNWEIPWTRIAADMDDEHSVLRPHACPDCGGTGALFELPLTTSDLKLPTRRGLPQNHYAQHVAALLRANEFRARSN
jgi:hypothetical protein